MQRLFLLKIFTTFEAVMKESMRIKTLALLLLIVFLFPLNSCVRKVEVMQRYVVSALVYKIPEYDKDDNLWMSGNDSLPDLKIFLNRRGNDFNYNFTFGTIHPTNEIWDIDTLPVRLTFTTPQPISDSIYYIYMLELDDQSHNFFSSYEFMGWDNLNSNFIYLNSYIQDTAIILECEQRLIEE
jgi:hypothetical protein